MTMETKQTSSSSSFTTVKSFRLLIFCLILSTTVIFLSVFFLWATGRTTTTPFPQPTNLPTLNHYPSPLNLSSLQTIPNGFSTKVQDSRKANESNVVAAAFEVKLGDISSFSGNLPANLPHQITSSKITPNSENSILGSGTGAVSVLNSVINASPPIDKEKSRGGGSCDVTKGRWVFDERYPLYSNTTCPFIDEGFNCQSNGRLDKNYMKWRWQPEDCNIPRFNASEMLGLIKGKRLVFVGDSLNRNQWESMLCLLKGAVKDPRKVYEARGRRITKSRGDYSFKFVDYKCTVEYYVSHFLVRETKARIGKKRQQTLRIDAIDKGSSRWRGADILVFNTAHWWSHYKTKAGINYYQEGGQVYPHLDVSTAFRKAMTTWATWIDNNISPRKTQVFSRSSAPSHFRGGQWDNGGHCKEASKPSYTVSSVSYEKNMVLEDVLKKMRTPVAFLNITEMSSYRIDGHPSIYGRKTSDVEDCSHWCLPGVPDSWNEMLYFHLKIGGTN